MEKFPDIHARSLWLSSTRRLASLSLLANFHSEMSTWLCFTFQSRAHINQFVAKATKGRLLLKACFRFLRIFLLQSGGHKRGRHVHAIICNPGNSDFSLKRGDDALLVSIDVNHRSVCVRRFLQSLRIDEIRRFSGRIGCRQSRFSIHRSFDWLARRTTAASISTLERGNKKILARTFSLVI